MGVVLRQAWSKSQWTVLMGYLTISTNVRCYQTHHRWQFFSFMKIAHRCIVCVTQSNWVKYVISCFRVSPGSAEAQVTWGGIVKRLLIVYFIRNISAKKYQNPFMCVKVIASQRWDVFLRHGVVCCVHGSVEFTTNLSRRFLRRWSGSKTEDKVDFSLPIVHFQMRPCLFTFCLFSIVCYHGNMLRLCAFSGGPWF